MNLMRNDGQIGERRVFLLLLILALSLVGCGLAPPPSPEAPSPTATVKPAPSFTAIPPTSTPTPIPMPEIREIVLTFDGKTCQYDGPAVTTPGQMTVSLVNKTEWDADWWMLRLDDDKTWRDMLDYIGEPGSYLHPPPWTSVSIVKSRVPDNPDAWEYTLKEGTYVTMCCTCDELSGPRGVWPGAPLEVRSK